MKKLADELAKKWLNTFQGVQDDADLEVALRNFALAVAATQKQADLVAIDYDLYVLDTGDALIDEHLDILVKLARKSYRAAIEHAEEGGGL